jgi:hypothetical protein
MRVTARKICARRIAARPESAGFIDVPLRGRNDLRREMCASDRIEAMASNRRKFPRRTFSHNARIVGNDGTWGHNCQIIDVSATGARLATEEALNLPNDFLLTLTKSGSAVRKCHRVWSRGKQIGIEFDAVHA